jgi:hypothetical protein
MPKAGDLVLIGHPRVTMPSDWFLATVLWTDGREEILTEHTPPSRMPPVVRQVFDVEHVRAIGSIDELVDIKARASEAVCKQRERIHECTTALGRAREELWAVLDKINLGYPKVIEPTAGGDA